MRIILIGTPDFALPALRAILAAGYEVVAVYTQKPRAAGRGLALRKSPVQIAAEQAGLQVLTPERLRDPSEQARFSALRADATVVVAYGLILPKAILDGTKHGAFNIHASLLPRWRGAAPIQRAIIIFVEEDLPVAQAYLVVRVTRDIVGSVRVARAIAVDVGGEHAEPSSG